ncbi:Spy/CpxP family protein refolding chaperone [Halomonas sp.]|uniref:Spy/CpxP family protein refolding chaperone n=1 Tax=Halomonas sp. TaxID=1486246 RepID=UPI00384FD885
MSIRKHTIALGMSLALGLAGTGIAAAQQMGPGMMGSGQGGMGPGMMGYGQGGMGPGMMGYGQGGMGPGMMGYGQGGMGPGMMMGNMMPCPMMGESMGMMSSLDPDQRSQMRELMQAHRPAQFERMGKLMDLRLDMMEAMHGERPDPERLQALHAQMAELQGETMAAMMRMRNAMHDLLTDEQRQQLRGGMPVN